MDFISLDRNLNTFFTSEWLCCEAAALFGTLGLLVLDEQGKGNCFTLDLTDRAHPVREGWAPTCEGILTLDGRDPIWAEAAQKVEALEADPDKQEIKTALRIIFTRQFFTQLAALTLDNWVTSNSFLVSVTRTEKLFHACLVDTDGKVLAAHTAKYAGTNWQVIPGLIGDVRRIYVMGVDQTREYIIQLRAAQKVFGVWAFWAWLKFFMWYLNWQRHTSVVLGGG